MRSSGDRRGSCEATYRGVVARAVPSSLVAITLAASCAPQERATIPHESPTAEATPSDPGAAPESPWLGAWPKAGCFWVARDGENRYRFVIEDVEYRSARAPRAGGVDIFVHAVGIGDLEPRPIHLPRDPRLEFSACGPASGAFEILLLLVDTQGHRYEPRSLRTICLNKRKGP